MYNVPATRNDILKLYLHVLSNIYQETLFEIAKHTMPDPPPFNQFGFFLTKNASKEEDLGLYTMYTGEGDPYKLATIASYNGHTNLGKDWIVFKKKP